MTDEPANPMPEGSDPEAGDAISQEAGRFAEKLQKDLRIWSANEGDASDRQEDAAQALAAQQVKASVETAKKRASAKPKVTPQKVVARKPGPFSMSYDGLDIAKHNASRRALGAK